MLVGEEENLFVLFHVNDKSQVIHFVNKLLALGKAWGEKDNWDLIPPGITTSVLFGLMAKSLLFTQLDIMLRNLYVQ